MSKITLNRDAFISLNKSDDEQWVTLSIGRTERREWDNGLCDYAFSELSTASKSRIKRCIDADGWSEKVDNEVIGLMRLYRAGRRS